MTIASFISSLKALLPEADWPWVFSALSFDPLVWESLGGELGQRALERPSNSPEDYTPAALALLALDFPASPESLRASPDLETTPTDNTLKASSSFNLAQAGLAALQLREAWRESGTWEAVFRQISSTSPTTLACLYAMLPDPPEMLRAAFSVETHDASRPGVNPALHALLANAMPPSIHLEALNELISDLPRSERLALLGQVQRYRPELAPMLAQLAINLEPPFLGALPITNGERDNGLGQIEKSLRSARLYQLAHNHEQALTCLNEAALSARCVQADVAAQMAQVNAQNDNLKDCISAWEKAVQFNPDSVDHLAGWVLALISAGQVEDAQALLDQNPVEVPHAGILLASARLAVLRGDNQIARQEALKALEASENATTTGLRMPVFLAGSDLSELLLELDACSEATRAAELSLTYKPNDSQLLALLARAQLAAHQPILAVQAAHLATALLPERPEIRQLLARCLEAAGDWPAAMNERLILQERLETTSPEDLRDLATCALYAGEAGRAAHVCQLLLKQDQNDGLAWALLGQSAAAMGDTTSALDHLQHASELAPELSAPWLALSRLYRALDRGEKSLEALQAASLATPDLPEIHLALGETYLAQGALTQSLTSLRAASALAEERPGDDLPISYRMWSTGDPGNLRSLADQVALRLGQTLHQLGHPPEARQILEGAYQRSPNDAEIAHAYAQVLVVLDDLSRVLEPLETVMRTECADAAPYLEYARCALALHQRRTRGISLDAAIAAIHRAAELAPDNAKATALLAEALAANDELPAAMEAYRRALESDLAKEPIWQARLSLGLGEVAHKLGQIETAIAALQEASQANPSDAHVQRSLSEAYDAAGLSEDAHQAARAALMLAPDDVENLNWFANQALNLEDRPGISHPDAHKEAIEALERATRLAPDRGDIWVHLGQMQLESGDRAAALNALIRLADPDIPASNSTAFELYQAAQGLSELGEADAAVSCLERALQNGPDTSAPADPCLLDLLTALSTARRQTDDMPGALQALDQAIAISPDEPALYLQKADMLLELAQTEADPSVARVDADNALACLESAMRLNPHDPDLQRRAALTHRSAGELPLALSYAAQMVDMSATISQAMSARTLAADLALAMLQTTQARAFLDGALPPSEPAESVDDDVSIGYRALRAEMALEAGDERGAVEELVNVLEIAPENPRIQAIQARIIHSRDELQVAGDTLDSVLKILGDPSTAPIALIRSAAQAALELGQWEVAVQLCQQACVTAPMEPRSHLDLGRAMVLRAEFFKLCRALDAIQRCSDSQALSDGTQLAVELALEKAETLVTSWNVDLNGKAAGQPTKETGGRLKMKWADPLGQIQRWRARSLAIFRPSPEASRLLASLPPHPDDAAARVACLRELDDLTTAGLAAREYPQHPLVLLQLALTLMDEKPRQAMAAIHAAGEILSQPSANRRFRSAFGSKEIAPLIHALLARLFHRDGNRASDEDSALQSILSALAIWPDEPRWHALVAEIYLGGDLREGQSDLEAAISHLEQAVRLDPDFTPPLLVLGQVYLREGSLHSLQKAAHAFEQAAQAAPDMADPWIWLAQTYRDMGNLEQAAAHAERAVTLAPNQIRPLILRGEIALQANNPRGALSRAQAALRIQSDDPDALLLLARALNDLDRPEEALDTLEKALPLTFEALPLSLEKVRLLSRAKGKDAALQALQSLTDHYPEEPRVLALQAETLETSGESEAAIRTAQRALRSQSSEYPMSTVEQAQLHFLLGRLLRRSGQLDQAVHHLSETIRLSPDLVDAYLEIGHVHQERRQHNQALNAFRQAIAVAPRDHRPYYLIGQALKESKDYLGAEKMLRRATELAPDDVSIHRLLGAVVALNLVHNRREPTRDANRPA
jgi:tetratricopeptide (TPR) repeat protein